MILFLSPHDDDADLFGSFIIQREKAHVIVCTDSYIQAARGEGITAEQRRKESIAASEVTGYPLLHLGLRDDTVDGDEMAQALGKWMDVPWEKIYIPMLQGGNKHHDMVHIVASILWPDKVIEYATYTKTALYTIGNVEVIPSQEELDLKNKALMCHESQFRINRPHFDAVMGKSEWLNDPNKPLYQHA